MNLAGYIILTSGGEVGTRGTAYTYILAGNGLFLETENPHLRARIQLAPAEVRGLSRLEPDLRLTHGRVPAHLLALAVAAFSERPDLESYAAIVWDGQEYRLVLPDQVRGEGHVTYEPVPGTVVSLHSHGRMGAFFSNIDDADDQGFLVSVVVGHLDRLVPSSRARLCVCGYFAPVDLRGVFEGALPWLEEREM